jgi:hypothetical protein
MAKRRVWETLKETYRTRLQKGGIGKEQQRDMLESKQGQYDADVIPIQRQEQGA